MRHEDFCGIVIDSGLSIWFARALSNAANSFCGQSIHRSLTGLTVAYDDVHGQAARVGFVALDVRQ
jgi:hypothetical protein